MHALIYTDKNGPAECIERPTPTPSGRDLLVAIEGVAINPVDLKIQAALDEGQSKICGWDAAGTIIAKGPESQYFNVGDKIFYAGDVSRDGCFASHQCVDERIVAIAPATLFATEASTLPLTSLTAWELLFDRLRINLQKDAGKTLLIIGGAGGVGSMLIQLAKQLAGLTVVATTSNDTASQWCRELGADHIVSHQGDLVENYQHSQLAPPDYIICLADSDHYFPMMATLIAPHGLIGLAVNFEQPVDLNLLKNKSAGIVWEFMFTRPMLQTEDMQKQQMILKRIAELVDIGCLRAVMTKQYQSLTPDNLYQAHQQLLSAGGRGKIALGAIDAASTA
jgi:NADPH2:quinone reductase